MDYKKHENISIFDVAYKIRYDANALPIIFEKVVGWKYNRTKYLWLFYSNKKYDRISYRIRYLITSKSNI